MKTLIYMDSVVGAEILRTRLEDSGIVAVVLDDSKPYTGTSAMGVRIAVSDGQYEEAVRLMREWGVE